MGLKLDHVVPWGRSLEEYCRMFALSSADQQRSILDCAAGPASFNAELTQKGGQVVSCDPIYQFSADDIEQRIQATYDVILEGVRQNLNDYHWRTIASPEALGQVRLSAMQQFLQDFPGGLLAGRYRVAELPHLPFGDRSFQLALSSHFLFTYSDHFSTEFHLESIQELCRVAPEVRIFPVINISGEPSPHLQPVMQQLEQMGYQTVLRSVNYEFQKGANQVLVCTAGDR